MLIMEQKNLVFFMTDQQRYDTLFAAVDGEPVTPTWNRLASEGVYFPHTYSTCPLCVPARTSLAAGLNPLRSKMVLNDLPGRLARPHKSLHRMLYDAGYEVGHIGVNHISLMPPLKESLQFAVWEDDESWAAYAQEHGVSVALDPTQRTEVDELWDGEYKRRPYSNAIIRSFEHDLSLFKDVWFADRAVQYIMDRHTRPFALFVCLWAPHPPLVVPPVYSALFPSEKIELPPFHGEFGENEPKSRPFGAARQLGQQCIGHHWKDVWAAHYALCRLADDQLKKILDALQATDVLDNTLIVCTADHGEQLGEHLMYQKMEMYESAIRVPAVMKLGSLPHSIQSSPISHLNFVPTILDLLDIHTEGPFEAKSLAESVRTGQCPAQEPVFAAYSGNHALGDIRRMVVSDGMKYVWDGTEGELYDLTTDPFEQVNLSGKGEWLEHETRLHTCLATWGRESGDWIEYTRSKG